MFGHRIKSAIVNQTSGGSAKGKLRTRNSYTSTLNIGVAATVEFERDHDRLLPRPNICGCGYVYRHISFITVGRVLIASI